MRSSGLLPWLVFLVSGVVAAAPAAAPSESKLRARELGVPFDGNPGPLNAITDVAGVWVGHATLISGDGKLQVGKGPIRTGVTAILPRGQDSRSNPVFAAWFAQNGNGEMTGTAWIEESGFLHGGAVEEGSVGGGTGMICNGYKGGIGTASRRLDAKGGDYTVGVLVQCNYGSRDNLRIAGVAVGREIPAPEPYALIPSDVVEHGSIIVIVATDAPLLAHQLKRLAHRVTLGLGRNGSISGNGSGDIFIAFSTANSGAGAAEHVVDIKMLGNDSLDPIFRATVEATEEAIVNAMVAATDMTGVDDHRVIALPHDKLRAVLKKYGRLTPSHP